MGPACGSRLWVSLLGRVFGDLLLGSVFGTGFRVWPALGLFASCFWVWRWRVPFGFGFWVGLLLGLAFGSGVWVWFLGLAFGSGVWV